MTTEYRVLHNMRVEDLVGVVNYHLARGWKLHGGLVIGEEVHYRYNRVYQAMVKDDDDRQ